MSASAAFGVSEHLTCDGVGIAVTIALALGGLLMTFLGYRLYKMCLGLIGFALFFLAEGAIGRDWLFYAQDAETQKRIVVLVCCLAWGIGGALFCVKCHQNLQQKLGFLLGALLGVVIVCGVIFSIKEDVDQLLLPDYAGWDMFAAPTLGLPIAILCGYLMRNMMKYALMLASAAVGASLAIVCTFAAVECLVDEGADLGHLVRREIQGLIMIVLAAVGFFVQCLTDSEKSDDTACAGDMDQV